LQARAVQRNRNYDIRNPFGYEFGQTLERQQCQRTSQVCFVSVLEEVYQISGRLFIEKLRPGIFEIWRPGLTFSTWMVVTRATKRDSAELAEWGFYEWQAVTASRAAMELTSTRDKRAADVTERGEEKIERGLYKQLHR